jgi:hypothetical protein
MRGEVSTRKINGAGGLLYFSSGSSKSGRAVSASCPAATATSEIRKENKLAVDTPRDVELNRGMVDQERRDAYTNPNAPNNVKLFPGLQDRRSNFFVTFGGSIGQISNAMAAAWFNVP